MASQRSTNAYALNDESFWEDYLKGRPDVPSSFFERLFDYHASHGGEFGTVNDVGAGPGTFSKVLADRFDHVILTEPVGDTLDIAKKLLGAESTSTFEFRQSTAEDDSLRPGSVDVAIACNALHHTDVDRAVEVIAQQLKPGGTFCAAIFGGAAILDNNEAQKVWSQLFGLGLSSTLPIMGEHGVKVVSIMDSGYDAVPLPERYFDPGAQRLKLNTNGDRKAFCIAPDVTGVNLKSYDLGPHDVVTACNDAEWSFEADMAQLRLIHRTHPWAAEPGKFEPLWKELASIVGHGKVKAHWVVAIILATRNSKPF